MCEEGQRATWGGVGGGRGEVGQSACQEDEAGAEQPLTTGPQSLPELLQWLTRYAQRLLRIQVSVTNQTTDSQGFAKLIHHRDFELYEASSGAGAAGIALGQVSRESGVGGVGWGGAGWVGGHIE